MKATLAAIAVLVAVAAGGGALGARRQMRRVDVMAARARWPPAMRFEAADHDALDPVWL